MRLQQKQTFQIQCDLLGCVSPSELKMNSSVAIYLPKLHTSHTKNKCSSIKEYQSGSRIINQLPLLIFNSTRRKTTKNTRLQRCNTEQKKSEDFGTVSPFFNSYIRKSLQRRKMETNVQNQRYKQCKKSLIQVVSLDYLSINNPSNTKTSFKPLSPQKPHTNFIPYAPSQSNQLNLDLVAAQDEKKPKQLLLQKRCLRLAQRETTRFQKLMLKMRSERPKGIIQREEELSPWNMDCREDLQ